MIDQFLAAFAAIASALFITELTDKDALLLLTLATKARLTTVFLAGSTAFTLTTALFVAVGTLINAFVPIVWVKLVGGAFMVAYGVWEAKGLVGQGMLEKEERSLAGRAYGWRFFVGLVAALALLDIAGDATEVLTIVLVAHYSDATLVFAGACTGLILATGFETILGNRLGKLLTPKRMKYISMVVFLLIGLFIILSTVA